MYIIVAAGVAGAAGLIAADMSSDAMESAANTQADASRSAQDMQYKMWQEQQANQKPWLEAGKSSLNS